MAQLKDDCFAFGDALIPYASALSDLEQRLDCVVGTETVPLRSSLGHILAADIVSTRNVPPHDNSAVDGFAVFFGDLKSDTDTVLPVTGRVAAGHPLGRDAKRGEAVRIFTGAQMPVGMDTVFMEEDCQLEGNTVTLPPGLKSGSNRRFAGEDVKVDDVVVTAGSKLWAQEIGLAASIGCQSLDVYQSLKVGVFSTGDEVRDPSDDAPEGCIFDANRYTVMSMLDGLGIEVTDLGILPDNLQAITNALSAAKENQDVLLTSGGVSAGEEDHVKAAVENLGSINFWRLAIKPGRPIALGQIAQTAFVGLPGNPAAAMVTFLMVAQPMLRKLAGEVGYTPTRVRVATDFDYKKKSGRREWVRASLKQNADGQSIATKHHSSGAGILTSMVGADGLVEIEEDVTRLDAGTEVTYLPFSGLLAG